MIATSPATTAPTLEQCVRYRTGNSGRRIDRSTCADLQSGSSIDQLKRDRDGVDVLNKRIELLERALQGRQSESFVPASVHQPAGGANASTVTHATRGGGSSSNGVGIDIDAVRNAEGMPGSISRRR